MTISDAAIQLVQEARKEQRKQMTRLVTEKDIHAGFIARIKYKVMITVMSLLELSETDPLITSKIRKTISIAILMQNLVALYQVFKHMQSEKQVITLALFNNHVNHKIAPGDALADKDLMIIELGFLYFTLISIHYEHQQRVQNDPEVTEVIQILNRLSVKSEQKQGIFDKSVITDLLRIFTSLFKKCLRYYQSTPRALPKPLALSSRAPCRAARLV